MRSPAFIFRNKQVYICPSKYPQDKTISYWELDESITTIEHIELELYLLKEWPAKCYIIEYPGRYSYT